MKVKKFWIRIPLLSLLFGIAIFFSATQLKNLFRNSSSVDVANTLNSLSVEDREALEGFLRCLYHDTFPYVLFGNKPMSIYPFVKMEPCHSSKYRVADFMDLSLGLTNPIRLKMHQGWEVWKKCEHLFPSFNFIFLENQDPEFTMVIMINKRCFLKTIKENIKDFREVLGDQMTPEKILENCLKSTDIFKDVLHSNEGLFGTLLGFGRHNAQLFSRKKQIEKMIAVQKFLFPSKKFSKLTEEYERINQKFTSFNEAKVLFFNPFLMTLPGFAADQEHSETQQLKMEYKKQYKNIINRYKKGSFLEITLDQFVHDRQ